jgi:transcriptional regulator with XRE-family HTH domain
MGKLRNRIPELLALKEIRDKKRYTQHEMALGTGLTDISISRFMRHETLDNITYASALALAQWLGVTMEELTEQESSD